MASARQRQVRRRRLLIGGFTAVALFVATFIIGAVSGASNPGPTVDDIRAQGCDPRFSVLVEGYELTRKTVINVGHGSCAGIMAYVSHDGPDGEPVLFGIYDLGNGYIEVDPRHAACGKRTHREGNRVVDGGTGVQWDVLTIDPTTMAPGEHNGRMWTAGWVDAPPCVPTPPTTEPPAPAPTQPPAPTPTAPPTVPPTAPGCPPGQVGPPAPGCPPDNAPTVPPTPTVPPWEPPPVTSPTAPGTPPCPPDGPPGGPFNPSCPSQGGYVAP